MNKSYAGYTVAGKTFSFTVTALVNKRDTFSVGFLLCITFMAAVHPYPKFRSCSMENVGFAHLLNCKACVIESDLD